MLMVKKTLTLPNKEAKLKRRMEISHYWYISRSVRRELVTPEVADHNIVFHKSRTETSDWFMERLNTLQDLNKKRYDVKKEAV